MIIHIPHSSTRIPDFEGCVVSGEIIDQEILKLTDWYTDEIFNVDSAQIVQADFSRIYCDVERFRDDSMEVMAEHGMGVLYERLDTGEELREVSATLRKRILETYYDLHHARLETAVRESLLEHGRCLIIDGHSFPDKPLVRDLSRRVPRPDINIGTDTYHSPESLVRLIMEFFEVRGYSVGLNWPFAGTIVPLKYYRKNPYVRSIMIEINRKLYLENCSSRKSDGFPEICNVISDFLMYSELQD